MDAGIERHHEIRRQHAEARRLDWERAEADFDNWPLVGAACDGSPLRRHPSWGDGVYEIQSGAVISPIAYSVRRSLRARGIMPFGDK